MLENILIILFFVWLIGVGVFGLFFFAMKTIDGETIVDSSYKKCCENLDLPENIIKVFVNVTALVMVIGWPVTLMYITGKQS